MRIFMSRWDKWQPLVDMMKERQNKWKEKLEELNGGRLVKQVYDGDVDR